MNNEEELRIKEKVNFFLEEKVLVHVKRKDKQFWNGLITEKKSEDVFIIQENELGFVHLFVCDIFDIVELRSFK